MTAFLAFLPWAAIGVLLIVGAIRFESTHGRKNPSKKAKTIKPAASADRDDA